MAAPSASQHHSLPSTHAAVLTPSDATVFAPTNGLYIGGTGHITVTMAGDNTQVLFSALPVGTWLPIRVTQVRATGTTATLIVGLW